MNFYDRYGNPVVYNDADMHLFLYSSSNSIAYIYEDAIYNNSGNQIGWFVNNWMYDLNGLVVFFTETSFGFGPIKPFCKPVPFVNHLNVNYVPSHFFQKIKRFRPLFQMQWSPLSGIHFFD